MNVYYFGSALNLSSIYMFAGAGAAISLKSGKLNLGGEGQIYCGGFICAVLLNFFSRFLNDSISISVFLSIFCVLISFALSFCISGLQTLFCTFLQIKKNADYLFTTYILSAATIPFIDGLIAGPARSKTDNLLATPFINKSFRFSQIMPPSALNLSFFAAIFVLCFFFFLIYRTAYGRKLCILGISQKFSNFAGYDIPKLSYSSSFISGGMHGLAGACAVCGTYFACHNGFYAGMGWNAFSASLLAMSNPLLIIPSSIFMGFLTTYSNKFAMYNNFGFDMTSLLQGVIILIISFITPKKRN